MRRHLAYGIMIILFVVLTHGVARAAAPTISSFAPTSGPIGTKVVVKGTGFTGATSVKIDGIAAVFAVNSATQITANVPATASGTIAVQTSGGTATSGTTFTVTPGALVSPASATPTEKVTVTGSGFDKFSAVDVYFDTTDVALGVSNGSGVVSVTVTIPPSSTAGVHWITADERVTNVAAQAAVTVNTNWLMQGFNGYNRGFNPYEGVITRSNVNTLQLAWEAPIPLGANSEAMIEVDGNLYVAYSAGGLNAYSSTGALLWTASPSDTSSTPSLAAADGLILLSGSQTVYAYKVLCGTRGATCTPTWSQSIGTSISSGLSVSNNVLYVPGGDGEVHPLDAANGTPGTSFSICVNSTGPVTTPVQSFGSGSFLYATGDLVQASFPSIGSSFCKPESTPVSPAAIDTDTAADYIDAGGALQHEGLLNAWSVQLGSTCTAIPSPAIAYGYVYSGCGGIGAYSAENGNVAWAISTPQGPLQGMTVADGAVYACIAAQLYVYDAYDGALLWSGGGDCNQAPLVVNGTVYIGVYEIAALTPQGVIPASVQRPSVERLHPDISLVPQRTP